MALCMDDGTMPQREVASDFIWIIWSVDAGRKKIEGEEDYIDGHITAAGVSPPWFSAKNLAKPEW